MLILGASAAPHVCHVVNFKSSANVVTGTSGSESQVTIEYNARPNTYTTIDNPITTTDETNCPITECKITKSLDGPDYDGDKLMLSGTNGNQIRLVSNSKHLWDETVWIKCNNKDTYKSFKIKFIQNPVECHMTDLTKLETDTIAHNMVYTNTANDEYNSAASTLFGGATESCPIKQCTLHTADCSTDYIGDRAEIVQNKTTKAFTFVPMQNSIPSTTDVEVCVRCENANQSGVTQKFMLNQPTRCDSALQAKNFEVGTTNQKTYVFRIGSEEVDASEVLKQKNGVYPDYFTNEEPRCPATTCSLMKKGCLLALPPVEDITDEGTVVSHIKIENKQIYFERDFASGYETEFCLSCSNDYMTETADNLSVYQERETPIVSLILSILFVVVSIVAGGFLINRGNIALKAKYKEAKANGGAVQKVEMADNVNTDVDQENTARVGVDKQEEVVEKPQDSDKQDVSEQPKVAIN